MQFAEETGSGLWEYGYIATYRNDLFLKSERDVKQPVFLPSEPKLHYNDYVISGKD